MTALDVHLPVAAQPAIDDIAGFATLAEELGYARVWMPETWGRDAVTTLTTIAERTTTIGLGSSVMSVYSRSPALLGQTATTLQEVSDGRFRLGVGPSGPILMQGWHGMSFERPLRRTREAVDIIRQVQSGNVVNYDGEIFNLAGFRLRCDPPDPRPPVDIAGMGPKAVELAGRFGDGWHAIACSRDGIRDRLQDFRRGLRLGDRREEDVRVTLAVTACAMADSAVARELARKHLAFYVGAMGTFYRNSLARQGYESLANDIASTWANGDPAGASELIDDDVLEMFSPAGSPAEVRDQLTTFMEIDGIDAIAIGFPRGASPAVIEQTIEAVAPASLA